jgi:hypothetical protein
MMPDLPHGLFMLLASVQLSLGCAAASAESRAVHQFEAQFECPDAHTFASPGGYRVEGCGSTAFYRCVKDAPRPLKSESEGRQGDVAGALLEGLWESAAAEANATVRCALEPSPLNSQAASGADSSIHPLNTTPHQAALALANQAAPLTLSLSLAGASLELFADPVRSPDYALLALHSQGLASYRECKPWLFHDGNHLSVSALQVVARDRLHWVVPTRELRSLQHSSRVDGNVCGLRFSLDREQREQLAAFAQRLPR